MTVQLTAIVSFCLLAALLCKVLERYAQEQALLISLCACAGVLLVMATAVAPILSQITDLFSRAGLQNGYANLICKAIGICWLTQFGTDLCRDCREEALSSAILLGGKITLLLMTLPLFEDLLTTVGGLLP